jgi:hypothetical protein
MSFKLYKKHLTIATGRKNAAILSMSYDGARLAGLRWRERPNIEQVRVEAQNAGSARRIRRCGPILRRGTVYLLSRFN